MLKEPLFFDNPFRGKVPVETVNTDHLEYVVKDLVQKGEMSRTRFQFSYANGEAVPYMVILNEVCALIQERQGERYAPIKPDIAAKMGAAMKNVAKDIAEAEAKKVQCPMCSGSGYIDQRVKNLGTLEYTTAIVECPQCQGTKSIMR